MDLSGGDVKKAETRILSFLEELNAEIAVDREGSDLFKINAAAAGEKIEIGTFTKELFLEAKQLYTDTDGALNCALYPATELWGFSPNGVMTETVPERRLIEQILPLLSMDCFTLEENTVVKSQDGAKLDFGAIAKGYAIGKAGEIARECGVTSGIIDCGGNLMLIGRHVEGRPFTIGIQNPRASGYFAKVRLENTAAGSSGDNERYFIADGIRYCHIMDTRTGSPVRSDVMSVTVIHKSGLLTDAYSTAVFVMGERQGRAFMEENGITGVITYMAAGELRYTVVGGITLSEVSEDYRLE